MSLLAALYGRARYRSNRAISAQIPGLVDQVLARLASQKEEAYEAKGDDDTFLFLPNLRDDILRHIHSLSKREQIWQRVRTVVEQNTNVRTGQREGKNGEVGRAWEWIGPSGAIEGSARRKGRVSWGANVDDDSTAATHKKWEEPGSRPIY